MLAQSSSVRKTKTPFWRALSNGGMNGRELPIAHGAPLRLRVEKQLGYKSLKFVQRVLVTDRFEDQGKFGEPRDGWAWYVGI